MLIAGGCNAAWMRHASGLSAMGNLGKLKQRIRGMASCPLELQLERRDARALSVIAAIHMVGLAWCATGPTPRPGSPSTEAAPYVGTFTGEFVDGTPLHGFPTIEVVCSRSSDAPGT